MDVYLGKELGKQKIFVFEHDLPSDIAVSFGEQHSKI